MMSDVWGGGGGTTPARRDVLSGSVSGGGELAKGRVQYALGAVTLIRHNVTRRNRGLTSQQRGGRLAFNRHRRHDAVCAA
ncbi:hypothetical protein chiPu_0016670 [Chiloscyllium punctatum]|uniref:Uncharacterized protein n=1 Tax=Chiloscyllium punctatum TaxID=137246 RepID=A0A401T684_CHIPU|nr:hypothetical protein [Chiloscyllium punctatum]